MLARYLFENNIYYICWIQVIVYQTIICW